MPRRMLLLLALLLAASTAYSKTLHWRAVEVEAHLDGNGLLHVVETQTYVFDGDWNGGERQFDIRAGQSLQLEGVERVDGARIVPLTRGGLAEVDHYDLLAGWTLRWRSRLPSDPPFDNQELTYRIRYTLSGILRGQENRYRLAHDFAFPERPGVIQRYALHFTADPLWSGIASPQNIQQHDLEPGKSVIVSGDLGYHGSAAPSGVIVPLSPGVGYGLLAWLAAGIGALLLRFFVMERRVGRFGKLTPLTEIDGAWLDKTVFSLPPEVVGAAWDGKVGAPEVAAILATLAHEKKIETRVEPRFLRKPKLAIRLLVERESISGYRGSVIKKLFFGGRKNTDTDALRKHYKNSGLDLAASIRIPIEQRLERLPNTKWAEKTRPVNWQFDALAVVAGLVLLAATGVSGGSNDGGLVASEGFGGLCVLALAAVAAHFHSRALNHFAWRFALVLVFAAPLLVGTIYYLLEAPSLLFGAPALMAVVAWNLAVFNLILDALRIDEAPEKIALRKKLFSARAYFVKQLRTPAPSLRDEWFPYLLAFGLGANVDAWFRAYGKAGGGGDDNHSSSPGGSSSGSSNATHWTGGGGTFGGGGASSSWGAAAAGVGAGVSASSSSSGSSSSGGGGSSSGGGGGGGW